MEIQRDFKHVLFTTEGIKFLQTARLTFLLCSPSTLKISLSNFHSRLTRNANTVNYNFGFRVSEFDVLSERVKRKNRKTNDRPLRISRALRVNLRQKSKFDRNRENTIVDFTLFVRQKKCARLKR